MPWRRPVTSLQQSQIWGKPSIFSRSRRPFSEGAAWPIDQLEIWFPWKVQVGIPKYIWSWWSRHYVGEGKTPPAPATVIYCVYTLYISVHKCILYTVYCMLYIVNWHFMPFRCLVPRVFKHTSCIISQFSAMNSKGSKWKSTWKPNVQVATVKKMEQTWQTFG